MTLELELVTKSIRLDFNDSIGIKVQWDDRVGTK